MANSLSFVGAAPHRNVVRSRSHWRWRCRARSTRTWRSVRRAKLVKLGLERGDDAPCSRDPIFWKACRMGSGEVKMEAPLWGAICRDSLTRGVQVLIRSGRHASPSLDKHECALQYDSLALFALRHPLHSPCISCWRPVRQADSLEDPGLPGRPANCPKWPLDPQHRPCVLRSSRTFPTIRRAMHCGLFPKNPSCANCAICCKGGGGASPW